MKPATIALSLAAAGLLSLPSAGQSAGAIREPSAGLADLARATTTEELLLFWEEKDLYVQSPTRNRKPISQAAENMTVITAQDIEDMNAHTVSEILTRVPGLFVLFQGRDFGSPASYYIQGSDDRHVLVLVDGIAWNFAIDGHAETAALPVRIIERIELIEGPASSVWGSSLGGVVNIITKNTGTSPRPSGSVAASYGKRDTHEEGAEAAGKAGPAGYYLFAGRRHSDGLSGPRSFDAYAFYGKFNAPLSRDVNVELSLGAGKPRYDNDILVVNDLKSTFYIRSYFTTASLDAALTPGLKLHAAARAISHEFQRTDSVLGVGVFGPADELFFNPQDKEKTTGESVKLVWTRGRNTAVLGADADRTELAVRNAAGPFMQSLGMPETTVTNAEIDKWALYANDTVAVDKFSFTPGVRLDRNNITGSFTSPSLGATYAASEKTTFRASAARGFTIPPLAYTSVGGIFFDPNPSLKPEQVKSYQAGIETGVSDYLWIKTVVFRHDVRDAIEKIPGGGGPPANNDLFVNLADIRRQGYELEAKTAPVHNVSLKAGYSYVRVDPSDAETKWNSRANAELKYEDRKSLMAGLVGYYVRWDRDYAPTGKFDTFLWDLNLRKTVRPSGYAPADVFVAVHNIFNGDQYFFEDRKNPRRWTEAGVRLAF